MAWYHLRYEYMWIIHLFFRLKNKKFHNHDGVMPCKCFPHQWSFVRGIRLMPVIWDALPFMWRHCLDTFLNAWCCWTPSTKANWCSPWSVLRSTEFSAEWTNADEAYLYASIIIYVTTNVNIGYFSTQRHLFHYQKICNCCGPSHTHSCIYTWIPLPDRRYSYHTITWDGVTKAPTVHLVFRENLILQIMNGIAWITFYRYNCNSAAMTVKFENIYYVIKVWLFWKPMERWHLDW